MSNGDDKLVEEYLKGDSEFSKLYVESDTEECPPDLREKILAQSRKEVESRPRLLNHSFVTKGVVPLAIAATVLVGVGLISLLPRTDSVSEYNRQEPSLIFRGGTESKSLVHEESPAKWVAYIESLQGKGEHEEARAQLKKFVARFKDYPIGDLKILLNEKP